MLLIPRGRRRLLPVLLSGLLVVGPVGCGSSATGNSGRKTIVVTYSILGSLVREAVRGSADVVVLIPNGSDPHDWEPSAKDISRIDHADLIVRNGLGLEGGIQDALDNAEHDGVETFTASDHVAVRRVGSGEGLPTGDPDQQVGAEDPHLWMDPITLGDVISALGPVLQGEGIDAAPGVAAVETELDEVDGQIAAILARVPLADRKLVTGHESLGYFAARYGFQLVGAIIPSLTSDAGVSARGLAQLVATIRSEHVKAVFTELGTAQQVADAIGSETGVEVVELASHRLPDDGKYTTFLLDNATKIAVALG
ncbi:MAG TPA: metal ABC transporter substrate-binding protein [Ilumatobacteraceae bacterium]|nr:metal ABC transporter substrate-binding protein [Ilumatobacteraceae bacterium]